MRCRSRALGSSTLQLPPKTLTPSQNASKSVQIADRSASQQNMYEEDDLRLPPSTGSIIVATAVGSADPKRRSSIVIGTEVDSASPAELLQSFVLTRRARSHLEQAQAIELGARQVALAVVILFRG